MTIEHVRSDFTILPTPDDYGELDVANTRLLSGTITNLDALQTVDGQIVVAAYNGDDLAPSTYGDLAAIAPLEVRPFSIDCATFGRLAFRLTASGGGCDVRISARPDRGRR